jgi:hypothetical protein
MPKTHVERAIEIAAPPADILPWIEQFRNWPDWSPWLRIEPEAKITFSEDGSRYAWEGEVIGAGEIERLPGEHPAADMACELRILKPWKSTSRVEFILETVKGGTRVRWTMDGAVPLPLFWMRPMVEGMVGMDYVRGLNMLKDQVETGGVPSRIRIRDKVAFPAVDLIGVTSSSSLQEVGDAMGRDFKRMLDWMSAEKLEPAGPPVSIYHDWHLGKGRCEYTLGFPLEAVPRALPGDFRRVALPALDGYVVDHTGPYRHLGNAWAVGMTHARCGKFPRNRRVDPFEIYLTDPNTTPEKEYETRVVFPRK